MIVAVTEFNRVRNGLKLEFALEAKMIREEIREFWDAKTLAQRVDAYIDTKYVWIGTQIKATYNTQSLAPEYTSSVELAIGLMENYLQQETSYDIGEHMSACELIVCDINAKKVAKLDEDGKVIKQQGLPNATIAIAELLLSHDLMTQEEAELTIELES